MSAQLLRTPAAEDDLFEIWLFISRNNPAAASRMLRKIERAATRLASNPRLGRTRPELATGLRSLPVRPYVVFYRLLDKGLELVRVLHGSRDIAAIFNPD